MLPRPQLENRECAACRVRPNRHLTHAWTDVATYHGQRVHIAVFRCVKAPRTHPEVRATFHPSNAPRSR